METPYYLNSLEVVAKRHGGLSDMNEMGLRLQALWTEFEEAAKQEGYNILSEHLAEGCGTHGMMCNLLDNLYRLPDCSYLHDCRTLRIKDREYGGSWHRRGGPGAFMMLARKWDRIQNAMVKYENNLAKVLMNDKRDEGVLDDLADLRCYLLLVLSWHQERWYPAPQAFQTAVEF